MDRNPYGQVWNWVLGRRFVSFHSAFYPLFMKSISSRRFLLVLLFCSPLFLWSQETIKVMQYNLLRYGAAGIGGCTPTGVTARNAWLTAIMEHTLPDVFGVNEIGPVEGVTAPATNLLNNILKPLNPAYERAQVTFAGGQDIANCLFYNSDKLGLKSQAVIPQSFRNIDYYKLYYKGPLLAAGDTTWLEVVVVHLSADNSTTRAAQTTAIMDYLAALNRAGNFLVMGDFNLDASSETSYQNMVAHADPDCKMNDPINLNGTWSNNTSAKHAWSQSTRSSSSSDCGSGGGLDDRFDFILCSNAIMNSTADISYVASSYSVVGNPYSPNPSVPSGVTAALGPMSDHHPVRLTLEVSQAVSVNPAIATNSVKVLGNPVDQELNLLVDVLASETGEWTIGLRDLLGREVAPGILQQMHPGTQRISIPTGALPAGIYFVALQRPGTLPVMVQRFSVAH